MLYIQGVVYSCLKYMRACQEGKERCRRVWVCVQWAGWRVQVAPALPAAAGPSACLPLPTAFKLEALVL